VSRDQAVTVADKIIADLRGRRGFRYLLEDIELEAPDAYEEIKASIVAILLEATT
jgi:hypothetical protein